MRTPATDRAVVEAGEFELFLYGTLLDPAVLRLRSGRRFPRGAARPAVLRGWRRVGLRGAPWPTLIRARHHLVPGLLLPLSGGPLRRLMAYEGAAYRLRPVRLHLARPATGLRRGFAWIAHPMLAGN
ncbi:gamma-glutamylcyclotransferase family protein [Falsiroseomonas tokyonensis]|uniref:Putative gamma-glutamylcyclotransferase n=1 Tax=Falsiroseomonas tokyonensis TaxID=430521 RepID=A0ABV7BWE3_9PROT|nr:gamma-glutamylcyclotransferase [Falsiroseomonas tokyonensis]